MGGKNGTVFKGFRCPSQIWTIERVSTQGRREVSVRLSGADRRCARGEAPLRPRQRLWGPGSTSLTPGWRLWGQRAAARVPAASHPGGRPSPELGAPRVPCALQTGPTRQPLPGSGQGPRVRLHRRGVQGDEDPQADNREQEQQPEDRDAREPHAAPARGRPVGRSPGRSGESRVGRAGRLDSVAPPRLSPFCPRRASPDAAAPSGPARRVPVGGVGGECSAGAGNCSGPAGAQPGDTASRGWAGRFPVPSRAGARGPGAAGRGETLPPDAWAAHCALGGPPARGFPTTPEVHGRGGEDGGANTDSPDPG